MTKQLNTLNFFETGLTDGPTLVFIPGLSGTTRYWQGGRLGDLEKKYRILVIDPLGFGDSPKPWSRYTVDSHVDALYETLKNEKQFALVGHSMGTLLAIGYAARHPEQVERLVLLSTPFFGSAKEARRFFSSQPVPTGWFFSNMVLAAVICIITRRIFGWLMPYFRPDLPREVAADIVKHSWRSFTSSFWEVICNYDAKKDADALGDLPVLCIHGDQDETAPFAGALALAAGRPSWQVQILPGVDHQPWLRAPQTCQEAVASPFIAGNVELYARPVDFVQSSKAAVII
ncbi:MAG: alpha/beta hydrolase [Chloroflexi bacterium]|nr:alpha/beta hydrolase [Chloroflexota bacterium]MBI3338643.1 alpha/beta hydrolase [Chloroflexota bacterium]